MESSVEPDQLASPEASWSGATVLIKECIEFQESYMYSKYT